jgi:glucose uptake protein
MYTPHTYPVALLMMLVSMLCWGSWANTQKIDKTWRFELYYWDYMWGLLACAILFGLTLGRTNPAASVSFFHNLGSASARSLVEAFAGGMIFNLGNLLLVAAISVAGMAVAFPLGRDSPWSLARFSITSSRRLAIGCSCLAGSC